MNDQHWYGYEESREYGGALVEASTSASRAGGDCGYEASSSSTQRRSQRRGRDLEDKHDQHLNDFFSGNNRSHNQKSSSYDARDSGGGNRGPGVDRHLNDTYSRSSSHLQQQQPSSYDNYTYNDGGGRYDGGGSNGDLYSYEYAAPRNHETEDDFDATWAQSGVAEPPPPNLAPGVYRSQLLPSEQTNLNCTRELALNTQRLQSEQRIRNSSSREAALRTQRLPSERMSSPRDTTLRTQRLPSEQGASLPYRGDPSSYSNNRSQGRQSSSQQLYQREQNNYCSQPGTYSRPGATSYSTPAPSKQANSYCNSVSLAAVAASSAHHYPPSHHQQRPLPSQHMALQREASSRRLRRSGSARSLGSASYGSSSSRGSRGGGEVFINSQISPHKLIEVMPGHQVPLRGAKETYACVENDFFMPVSCMGCSLDICCIQDAEFVICPCCRVVSPMMDGCGRNGAFGAGLGFTFEDLAQWQADITRHRERRP